VIGTLFGTGAIWQYFDYELKSQFNQMEKIRVENEIYDKLQLIQNETLSQIPEYIKVRDRYLSDKKTYQVQNDFEVMKTKLVNLITAYNRLEAKLSTIEQRSPRFFVIPVPPVASKLSIKDGDTLVIETITEPLMNEVEKDTKELFKEYGKKFPTGEDLK
jgi:hypothetical protein